MFRSSLFQLFPYLPILCDGYLTKWSFISRNANGTGMYLSVWRQINSSDVNVFRQIGFTRIDNFKVLTDRWTEYPVQQPFPVKAGDIIAIYYQSWEVLWPLSGHIPVTAPFSEPFKGAETNYGDAIITNKDASTLRLASTVNMENTARVKRFPALQAHVDPDFAATTPPPTTPPTLPPSPGPTTTVAPTEECEFTDETVPNARIEVSTTPSGPARDPRRCLSPFKTQGRCNYNAVTLRWFFDTSTQLCEMFWHYDCVVSQNIFVARDSCEYHCADLISGKLTSDEVLLLPVNTSTNDLIAAYDEISIPAEFRGN